MVSILCESSPAINLVVETLTCLCISCVDMDSPIPTQHLWILQNKDLHLSRVVKKVFLFRCSPRAERDVNLSNRIVFVFIGQVE